MKAYVGVLDRIFGKWTKIKMPHSDGSIREVPVTEKWLAKMQEKKKISQITKVHIWDPTGGVSTEELFLKEPGESYRVEKWTIGKQISKTEYDRFRDKNGDIYVMVIYEKGEPAKQILLSKLKWDNLMKSQTTKVHIWDPTGGVSAEELFPEGPGDPYRVEQWTIGKQIPQAQYDQFRDENGDIHVFVIYKEGEPAKQILLSKLKWDNLMKNHIIKVHIWDPTGGVSAEELFLEGPGDPYRVEQWTIGKQIPQAQYDQFRDENGDIYVMVIYKKGEPAMKTLLRKIEWDEFMKKMSL